MPKGRKQKKPREGLGGREGDGQAPEKFGNSHGSLVDIYGWNRVGDRVCALAQWGEADE